MYLGFDELTKEERPDKRIWTDDEKLQEHFAKVERIREKKYGGDSISSGEIEDPVQNEAARSLIAGD